MNSQNEKILSRKLPAVAVIVASAILATTAAQNAVAQDAGTPLEEMTVTGTNIPRPISDAAQPITVIDSLDIELSGVASTAELLRGLAYNSFGSFRERSGNSYGQISTVDLRGLGAEYTAVLINGKRVPGSPLTGASIVDLNTIPLSAIESIELLKDSASAIYGADAIGGVVSIRLKDDFEGFEIGLSAESPTREGANSGGLNLLFGKTFDRGNVMIGVEYYNKDAISDGDRSYSRADLTGPTFDDTEGVSVGGNTAFETDFSAGFALGDCDTSLYAGVFTNPYGLGEDSDGCGFPYANISLQTGSLERTTAFLNGNYAFSDNMEGYLDLRYTKNETGGRYAPAVGYFSFPESSPANTFGRDLDVFHRFVGHGNRDDTVEADEIVIAPGLRIDFNKSMSLDIWAQYYEFSGTEFGNTYVLADEIEAEVLAGNYDVTDPLSTDPDHLAAIAASSAVLTRDLLNETISFGATLNGEVFEMKGGTVGWAAGIEYSDEEYTDIYDEYREALNVLGSSGNSASGGRDRYATFGEIRLPVLESVEINAAVRYDDYSDFGSEVTPQVAVRYMPTDFLTLRTSWGEGFKAPNLVDLTQSLAESFDDFTDLYQCGLAGIEAEDCPTFQLQNFSGGNEELIAEESESINFGVIFDIDAFAVSLDYYNVEITNQVTELSLAQINDREADGTLPAGVIITRGASTTDGVPGVVEYIINPLTNGASLETSGLDLGINYGFDIGDSQLDMNVAWVHILEYVEQTASDIEPEDLIGTEDGDDGYPQDRATLNFRYALGQWTASWTTTYIASFENNSETADYDSWMGHDLTFSFADLVANLDLSAGILNLTDEGPSIDPVAGYNDSVVLELYPVSGAAPFAKMNYRF